jgi:hypothetical protein
MKKLTVLIIVLMAALAHRSDGQQAPALSDQLRLAAVMPRGAMLYLQASDLSALMKTWLASPVRSRFYDSASFAAFQKSRVYLKLQDRKKDIETAIGVGLDENRLAELAGKTSAVSIYDIGKIEMIFVTELPRARAIASALFKQTPQFQERSADGTSYYVRDVTTDGGRLNQQFCFAYVDGKLIVTTTEGLMIRAIANIKGAGGEPLVSDVVALAETARGFAAHDATMWLDQARLNHNRYFDNYWIHQNAGGELSNIQTALIDLRFTREGMIETRWFRVGDRGQVTGDRRQVTGGTGQGTGLAPDQLSSLMRFAPADAHLVEARSGGTESLAPSIEKTLFGKLPDDDWSPPEIPDRTRNSSDEDSNARTQRYSRLDVRFDIDADDEQAPKRGSGGEGHGAAKNTSNEKPSDNFVKTVGAILASSSGGGYLEMVRSRTEPGKPFVRFERAVAIQLKPDADINREGLERAILNEMRVRYVVSGIEPRLAWQDESDVRFVAQSLLEQGAAYAVSSNCLVLASSKEFLADVLQAAKAQRPAADAADGPIQSLVLLRVSAAKPVFDILMSKLDGRTTNISSARAKPDEDEEREIKFFSENLSSLIGASSIREARLVRKFDAEMLTERVLYSW